MCTAARTQHECLDPHTLKLPCAAVTSLRTFECLRRHVGAVRLPDWLDELIEVERPDASNDARDQFVRLDSHGAFPSDATAKSAMDGTTTDLPGVDVGVFCDLGENAARSNFFGVGVDTAAVDVDDDPCPLEAVRAALDSGAPIVEVDPESGRTRFSPMVYAEAPTAGWTGRVCSSSARP